MKKTQNLAKADNKVPRRAYKMYIISQLEKKGPKDWFSLTQTTNYDWFNSDDSLFKVYIEARLVEIRTQPNSNSRTKKSITPIQVIKTLRRNIKIATSPANLNLIAEIFWIGKRFQEFTNDNKAVTEYFEIYRATIEVRKSKGHHSLPTYTYIYYYWKKQEIDYAILEVSGYSDIWNGGTLTYYHKKRNPKPGESRYFAGSPQTFTKCVTNSNILFVDCKGRAFDPASENLKQRTGKEIHTFLTIYVGAGLIKDWQILLGTYSSVRRSHPIPACGIAVLQMVDSTEEAIRIINSPEVDERIYNFLHEKRLNTNLESALTSLDDLPSAKKTKQLSKYTGIYVGRHLDSNYDDISESGAYRTVLLQIFKNGKAIIRYLIGKELRELTGFFHPHEENLLYGMFKNDLQTYDSDKIISRIHFVLEVPLKKEGVYLNGVYSGFRENIDMPKTGLISFKHIPEAVDFSGPGIDEKLFPKNFKKIDQVRNEEITVQLLKPNFIRFFRGDFGNYFESLRKSIHPKLYEQQDVIYSQVSSKYQGPIGVFFIYSFSSMKRSIVRYPLMLNEHGIATLKYTTEDNITETALGKGIFSDQYLTLDFKLDGKIGNKGMYLFYVNKGNFSQLKLAAGISLRINFKRKPQSKREFLIPHFLPEFSGEKHFEAIDWTSVGAQMTTQFDSINFKDIYTTSSEFDSLKEVIITPGGQKGSVVETLFGREYNIITTSTATNEAKLLDREDFWKIYLIAAWWQFQDEAPVIERIRKRYLHQKAQYYRKLFKETKSYPYFYLSMEHGLINFDEERLFRELEVFIDKTSDISRMKELFLEWFKDVASEFLKP